MLNKEDFRRQLDLVSKSQEGISLGTNFTGEEALEIVKRSLVDVVQWGRSLEVLELDNKLPIKGFLEVLKEKIAPGQKLEKWGPFQGEIAYAFIYGFSEREVIDRPVGLISRSAGRGLTVTYEPIQQTSHFENGRNLLRVLLDGKLEKIEIYDLWQREKEWIFYPDLFGPVPTWEEPDLIRTINGAGTSEGMRQLAESLKEFYVGLKAGQGK